MVKKKEIVKTDSIVSTKEYIKALSEIQQHIEKAQIKATLAVNKELLSLYWFIGKTIVEKQQISGWGSNIIDNLAKDLQNLFPGLAGFSKVNIFRMRAFYKAYEKVSVPPIQFRKLPIFNIPWWHNVILLIKLKNNEERLWYAQKALDNGWSGTILEMQIESGLYSRQGKAITNFHKTLPKPHSDMAQQSLKDPYLFDFLTLQDKHLERDVELALIDHVQKFLLELGKGFAFIARQYHLEIDGDDYYIDMLFYHVKLRCYIVIELKNTQFKAEYAGKINLYLSAVDDLLRHPDDKPTIGLILCKTKKQFTAEYALRDLSKPIGIASYTTKISKSLPKELKVACLQFKK